METSLKMKICEEQECYVLSDFNADECLLLLRIGGHLRTDNEIVISKESYLYYYNQTRGQTLATVDPNPDRERVNTTATHVTKTQCHRHTQTNNAAATCHAVTQTEGFLEPIIMKEFSDFEEPVQNNENFDIYTHSTHNSEHSVAVVTTSTSQPKMQPLLRQSDDAISLPSNFSGFTNFESIKYRWMQ